MSNNISDSINAKCGLDSVKSATYFTAFADIIKETLLEHDSVALPGFGTFTTSKSDEKVIVEPLSGKHQLVPPSINVVFVPSLKLTKIVKAEK